MTISTMTKRQKKLVLSAVSIVFWLLVWELIARLVNLSFIIPTVWDIIVAFASIIVKSDFYLAITLSVGRVVLGLLLGTAIGGFLAYISVKSELINSIIFPVMAILKATPVASFIIILWFFFDKSLIPIIIALFMVAPIIWESVKEALQVKNKDMNEVAEIFEMPTKKRFRLLTVPTLLRYTLPATVSASALAWKAGIAAEIITLTKYSIGGNISNAKNDFEGAQMFAWTVTVVLMSIVLEKCIKLLLKRLSRKWD